MSCITQIMNKVRAADFMQDEVEESFSSSSSDEDLAEQYMAALKSEKLKTETTNDGYRDSKTSKKRKRSKEKGTRDKDRDKKKRKKKDKKKEGRDSISEDM